MLSQSLSLSFETPIQQTRYAEQWRIGAAIAKLPSGFLSSLPVAQIGRKSFVSLGLCLCEFVSCTCGSRRSGARLSEHYIACFAAAKITRRNVFDFLFDNGLWQKNGVTETTFSFSSVVALMFSVFVFVTDFGPLLQLGTSIWGTASSP